MQIQLQDSDQPKLLTREVTVSLDSPNNPRGTKEERFNATFIETTLAEREEMRKNALNDMEWVRGFTHAVDIELIKPDGSKASPEETLEYAINHPALNAALISTYSKSRSRNLKS